MRVILRFLYDLLYHRLAWTYDLVAGAVSLGRWNHWIKCVIPLIQGNQILELGFGPGHLQKELNQYGGTVYGLDESWQMIRQAAHRLKTNRQSANLVRGMSQNLPFTMMFDTVISTFPSDYILDPRTIEEVYRVLIPGGKLIILLAVSIISPDQTSRSNIVLSKLANLRETMVRENRITKISRDFTNKGFKMETKYIPAQSIHLLVLTGQKPNDDVS
jgi:ubiquinone/menaquinone biosynthesis C-methylase UbiE